MRWPLCVSKRWTPSSLGRRWTVLQGASAFAPAAYRLFPADSLLIGSPGAIIAPRPHWAGPWYRDKAKRWQAPAATHGCYSPTMKYLQGYAPDVQAQVRELVSQGRLGERLLKNYPGTHEVRTDRALYGYVMELKNAYLRGSEPLSKVAYDSKLQVIAHALGTHTTVSRVQGSKLKSKREIRIASLFKDAPMAFLKMITVHELAHLRERAHDKAFYQLCIHMEPDYHQLEFDLRLYLTHRDTIGKLDRSGNQA